MKRSKNLSTKIILMVEVILLVSSAIFCAVSISRSRVAIRQAIQQRMVDIANCAAGSVNGDILKNLKPGDENTPGYKAVYDTIAVFRDNVELEYVYTIRDEGDGRFTFAVDTDPEEPAAFGDEVKYTEALGRAAKGTASVDQVPYTDKWGQFYSAYSPVFDSSGRVAGIVAADFSVDWFDSQLREQTLASVRQYIVILVLVLLGAAIVCLITVRPFVRMQEQLLEEKVKAESANQAKSEFLANMSHEIRTPINAVLGMNEMILRESRHGRELQGDSQREVRESFDQIGDYAGEVESAGRSLLSIINDILDFSRIEAGKMELVRGRYQLSALLNDVSGMIRFKAEEKGLEFTLRRQEPLPDTLFGDEVRVKEILLNLLNNAVKYTEKGFVRLTVRAGDPADNVVQLTFIVEDSGIGIRRKDMDKLFSKFQRLDMERNSTVEGSGLGLVITRSLVDMMGGTIRVRSEYGKGSAFTVEIPQRLVSSASRAEASKGQGRADYHEAFHAPGARILIVDDTKMNLTVTVSLLKGTQVQTDTASGGAEAVMLAAERPYDMILMDQRMPEMDGTEALRRIREMKDGPNSATPVICLTADAIVGARERYLAKGFSDYLTKPVDSRKLEAMLIKFLPEEKMSFVPVADAQASGDGRGYAPLREAGIDPETGLFYSQGDDELYRTLLTEYARDYPVRMEETGRFLADRDWKNYGIAVHSLKSTSRMLGIRDLAEMAAGLEAAAKNGDEKTILRDHGPMAARYEKVIRAIRGVIREEDEDGGSEEVFEFAPDGM